jgi:SWI/SNF-related matrix-associated actin-dependent regulator 1 of chromatin subfamily A
MRYRLFFMGITLKEMRRAAAEGKEEWWKAVHDLEEDIRKVEANIRYHVAEKKAPAVLGYLLTCTEKTLVIAHHKHLIEQFRKALEAAGKGVVVHSGDYDSPEAAVTAFQSDPNVQFFIGQIQASSLSLTLTASHHVVIAELPQTRSDFDQAIDRVHRIGQEHDVVITVFTLDYRDAGEDDLLHMLEQRKVVADQVLDLKEPMTEADDEPEDEAGGWN